MIRGAVLVDEAADGQYVLCRIDFREEESVEAVGCELIQADSGQN